ncbi:MAG: VWA domain-containing protein [Acidobacteria bacterium]|nr:VWA domain-containing protein [Acidobacteriota bacterium]
MTFTWSRVLILCLFLSWAMAQDVPPRGTPQNQRDNAQFRVDVNLVTIRFSVKDRTGNFVNTLRERDFNVFEGGVKQEIAFFQPPTKSATSHPLTLTFLIDVSGSTFATRAEEIAAAENFLQNVPLGTETAVYGFAEKLYRFQNFTSKIDQVREGFERAHKAMGRTSLYASLAEVVEMLGRRRDGKRRVVVIASDGEDPETSRADSVIRLAIQNNVTIFSIWVPSARAVLVNETEPSVRATIDFQHKVFATLAERTGGRSFESFESIVDFEGTLAEINAALFGSLYSTGYYTNDPYADRESRRIEVSTNGDQYRVQGVFANLPERLRAKKQFVSALFNNSALVSLPENLHARFHEIGAALDLLPMKPSAELGGLPFRIQVSPFSLAGFAEKRIRTHLGIVGVLLNSRGEEVGRVRDFLEVNLSKADIEKGRSIVYNSKVVAPPGQYDLRLAVLDLSNWRMTAFQNRVSVKSN